MFLRTLLSYGLAASAGAPAPALAIRGYDPVAYFREGLALRGSEAFTVEWQGLEWRFVSRENRDGFAIRPERYAPQYDGYCAWAMTEARKAETDPEVWKIHNGRLYLNCSEAAHEKWGRDIPGNIRKADANWQAFLDGKGRTGGGGSGRG